RNVNSIPPSYSHVALIYLNGGEHGGKSETCNRVNAGRSKPELSTREDGAISKSLCGLLLFSLQINHGSFTCEIPEVTQDGAVYGASHHNLSQCERDHETRWARG